MVLLLLDSLLVLYFLVYPVVLFGGSLLGLDHRFLDGNYPAPLLLVPHSDGVFFLGLTVDLFGRRLILQFFSPFLLLIPRTLYLCTYFLSSIDLGSGLVFD